MAKNNNQEKRYGITYRQYPEIGKTIATMEGCEYDAIRILAKLAINNSRYFSTAPFYEDDDTGMNSSYRGTVVCNTAEGDVYDEHEGRKEAYKKVMKKYHKDLDRKLRDALKDARELAAGIEHYMDKKSIDYSGVATTKELKAKKFGSYKAENK